MATTAGPGSVADGAASAQRRPRRRAPGRYSPSRRRRQRRRRRSRRRRRRVKVGVSSRGSGPGRLEPGGAAGAGGGGGGAGLGRRCLAESGGPVPGEARPRVPPPRTPARGPRPCPRASPGPSLPAPSQGAHPRPPHTRSAGRGGCPSSQQAQSKQAGASGTLGTRSRRGSRVFRKRVGHPSGEGVPHVPSWRDPETSRLLLWLRISPFTERVPVYRLLSASNRPWVPVGPGRARGSSPPTLLQLGGRGSSAPSV